MTGLPRIPSSRVAQTPAHWRRSLEEVLNVPNGTDTASDTVTDTAEPRISVETARCDRLRALIKVTGELDLRTAAPLWAVLQSHVNSGRRFLRLDVSGVTFLDATALGGITSVHRDLLGRRGTLVITGVRTLVARVLRVSGLDEVLFISGPRADDDLPIPLAVGEQQRVSTA